MKRALSIAGSDCSGGAGIQADLKTFSAHGVFGMSVIVSVVAENTEKVIDVQDISEDMIKKQIEAVFEDIGVDAVKIGMLSNPQCMKTVAEQMKHYKPLHIVVDPVMYAKNGCPLMDPSSIDTLVNTIIPIADIITPNIPEAEKIINSNIQSIKEMEDAAKRIYDMGCKAVVIKGGHHMGSAIDVLYDGKELSYFASIVFQESDISNIIIKMGLGGMGLFIVIFSTVTTTYLDTFSVGICAESINKNWGVKKVATITCIVGTLIAVLVPSNKFEEFLYFIGSIFAPLFAVLFTDYFVLHKKENDRKFDVENIGMWIIGFAIYRVLMNYNTVIGNTLPTILIVMTLKFICNRVKCSIERK